MSDPFAREFLGIPVRAPTSPRPWRWREAREPVIGGGWSRVWIVLSATGKIVATCETAQDADLIVRSAGDEPVKKKGGRR